MIAFVKGKVHSYTSESVILDNHGIGYRIFMPNPGGLVLGSEVFVYTYQHIREDAQMLFGFITLEEHDLFLRLITVKGIGPKTAINALAIGGSSRIIAAIEGNDATYLKTLPGIGAKAASQIVLDLKGKLVESDIEPVKNDELSDAQEALKALGYKPIEINKVIKEVGKDANLSVDEYIKKALAMLVK